MAHKYIIPKRQNTILYTEPLLQRYAMRLINDTVIAERLVQLVLEDQYEIDGLAPSENLRRVLKTDLLNRCHYFKQSIIFDRPPANIPLRKFSKSSC